MNADIGSDYSYIALRHLVARLTLYALMDSSFWFDTINFGWSIIYTEGSQVIISQKNIAFISLKIVFVLANSVDLDEIPKYAEFHLCLHH